MKKIQSSFIALILLIMSCSEKKPEKNTMSGQDIISVKVSSLSSEDVSNSIVATGLISTEDQANYSFKIGGVISKIYVDEGQFFRKGQLLATLNATEIAAGVAQADLNVAKAQRDFNRANNLYKDSVFSLEQLQNTRTSLEVAQKSRQATAFNERYAKIYAVSDGFVAKKIANEGEIVGGGIPVFLTNSTQKSNSYLLKVGVTDREWAAIKVGQSAKVTIDGYPDHKFEATVFRKLQAADREIGSFQIELKLKLDHAIPAVGMFGKAEIKTDQIEKSVVIPYNALVEADGEQGFIFAPNGKNRVKKIAVNILKFDNNKVYLKEKPFGIDQIVISNSAYLNEQSIIKIIQ
ncbi:MAG: efflux transporter periplasmic adaptor subunit [Chryseobacterium sp.]|jgi:RND family efflux transporter MFP subunit|uniref:efflux RND transporter periplasmic adaptor subunit n=1 Tax=Chryseobacterium sp. TaxID=1871047 RepID=UPI0026278FCD|nr:efflux RND transporter periplasmic adaptor subunit [Chryseobacterium sp.]MDF2551431.1 efflux transporter periplasmic adaptor subunit [Chryseobacterium sp.]